MDLMAYGEAVLVLMAEAALVLMVVVAAAPLVVAVAAHMVVVGGAPLVEEAVVPMEEPAADPMVESVSMDEAAVPGAEQEQEPEEQLEEAEAEAEAGPFPYGVLRLSTVSHGGTCRVDEEVTAVDAMADGEATAVAGGSAQAAVPWAWMVTVAIPGAEASGFLMVAWAAEPDPMAEVEAVR